MMSPRSHRMHSCPCKVQLGAGPALGPEAVMRTCKRLERTQKTRAHGCGEPGLGPQPRGPALAPGQMIMTPVTTAITVKDKGSETLLATDG